MHRQESLEIQGPGSIGGIQGFGDTFANALSEVGTLPASPVHGDFWEFWPQESLGPKDGTTLTPWENSGKLGKLREGQCLLGGVAQIQPTRHPCAVRDHSGLGGLPVFPCSYRPSLLSE